ncbi:MAG: cbb3-type cytochrome c oxidase N-terminal domain-containing protein [Verrucomicrobiales bacterium]|nr:cbb3-type cytochrome c oxidase N-terminal domain-containing protein [Verrucomicrobiales bacterium]
MSDTDNTQYRRGDFARAKGEVILREHEYDGIQEFDQKLPNWWLFTFYGAIVFFFGMWFLYYTIGVIPSDHERITTAVASVNEKKSAALADTMSNLTDAALVNEWATDESRVKAGEAIYLQVCIACHGPNMDAPTKLALSLVDHEWKYGNNPLDIFKLINNGTPAESKGMEPSGARMMAFGQLYTPDQIAELTAYIISKNKEDFKDF